MIELVEYSVYRIVSMSYVDIFLLICGLSLRTCSMFLPRSLEYPVSFM